MALTLEPIGVFRTSVPDQDVPRFYLLSALEGELQIEARFAEGLRHLEPGQSVVVLFHFHKSPAFTAAHLSQVPPTRDEPRGVFSTCSPVRPNPIGMSVVEVVAVEGCTVRVRHTDMLDGTPILDIKPYLSSVPEAALRRGWLAEAEARGKK